MITSGLGLDGTNIAGIGTENPQFEGVNGSNGEVVNSGDDQQDYQYWTNAQMKIDLDGASVDFRWEQDGTGAWEESTGHAIPLGKEYLYYRGRTGRFMVCR